MKGIELIKDQNGKTIKAVIDLRIHQALFEEIFERYQAEKIQGNGSSSTNVAPSHLNPQAERMARTIIEEARSYLGTRHMLGGSSKSGIDCSGLVQQAFSAAGIRLPRSSRDQATSGMDISLDNVVEGDLVFFATGSDPNRISHVAIITATGSSKEDLQFIHASTSRGVVEEQLFKYGYWQKAYRHARRVLVLTA